VGLIRKGNKLYSIYKFKCPKCHCGDFFVSHSYDLKNLAKVKDKCDKCNLPYMKEPGFYFGAMYVAYALSVAVFVFFLVLFMFFPYFSDWFQIGIIGGSIILSSPYLFSLSKIIWANFFFHYEVESEKNKNHE